MKRTDITELFPEASKEAIDKLMAINGSDVNAARGELDSLREQLEKAKNNEDLTKAQQQITQLTDELNGMKAAETLRLMREKVATEKKVPANLLTGETEEACAAQAEQILTFAKSAGYPAVPDGGGVHTPPSTATRDKFADWAKDNL